MKFLEILTMSIIYLITGFVVMEIAKGVLHVSEFGIDLFELILGVSISLNASAKLNQNK